MHTARRNEQDLVQVVLDIATVNLTDQRPRCQVLRRSELGVNPAQKTGEMHVNRTSRNRSAKGGDWERESGITRGLPTCWDAPGSKQKADTLLEQQRCFAEKTGIECRAYRDAPVAKCPAVKRGNHNGHNSAQRGRRRPPPRVHRRPHPPRSV